AIATALPPYVTSVALFVDPEPDEVLRVLAAVPIGLLQFHGDESPELCRAFGRPYVKAVAVHRGAPQGALLEYAARYADAAAWLFDAPPADGLPGGTRRAFDWTRLSAARARPLVLSGGLDAGNVAQAIRLVRPWAVD